MRKGKHHDRFSLNMEIVQHVIRVPSYDEANDVSDHAHVEEGH